MLKMSISGPLWLKRLARPDSTAQSATADPPMVFVMCLKAPSDETSETLRVPLFQMDAAVDDLQRSVMLDTIERERARRFGLRDAADLRRPGFRYNTSDAARDARQKAREQYLDELENAWRAPPVGAGERGQIGQREANIVVYV
jgi:hypothetical protein